MQWIISTSGSGLPVYVYIFDSGRNVTLSRSARLTTSDTPPMKAGPMGARYGQLRPIREFSVGVPVVGTNGVRRTNALGGNSRIPRDLRLTRQFAPSGLNIKTMISDSRGVYTGTGAYLRGEGVPQRIRRKGEEGGNGKKRGKLKNM